MRVGGLPKNSGRLILNLQFRLILVCCSLLCLNFLFHDTDKFIILSNSWTVKPVRLVFVFMLDYITDMTGKLSIRDILAGENMFDGTNFPDWEMNLRIVLGHEKVLYTIEKPIGPEPPQTDADKWKLWKTHQDDNFTAQSVMLASMIPKFRRENKGHDPYEMMAKLRDLHTSNLQVERYEIHKKLFRSRMVEGMSVEKHVTDMIAYIDRLATLDMAIEAEMSIDLILQSLPDSWGSFVMNYNMLNKEKTLGELMAMLKEAEPELSKGKRREAHVMHMPKKGKGKSRKYPKPSGGVKKVKAQSSSGKTRDKSQDVCLFCGKRGHWKRDCRAYKAELKDKKAGKAPASGMFVIEINMSISSSKSWIFDTGCGTHICTDVQDLQISRRLTSGEIDLCVGNGSRVAVLAVGTYVLSLPSGHVLTLPDCYHVPSLTSLTLPDLLGLIHSDVCGPMSTQARGGYDYFVTFTDDKSRYD